MLVSRGCEVVVVPAELSADKVVAMKPDGVFFIKWTWRPRTLRLCYKEYQNITSKKNPNFWNLSGPSITGLSFWSTDS